MKLRDWMSNSKEVFNKIPLNDQANRRKMNILGLLWSVEEDSMVVTSIISKRKVLSQIYIPLGPVSPVTLRVKLFLQTI